MGLYCQVAMVNNNKVATDSPKATITKEATASNKGGAMVSRKGDMVSSHKADITKLAVMVNLKAVIANRATLEVTDNPKEAMDKPKATMVRATLAVTDNLRVVTIKPMPAMRKTIGMHNITTKSNKRRCKNCKLGSPLWTLIAVVALPLLNCNA